MDTKDKQGFSNAAVSGGYPPSQAQGYGYEQPQPQPTGANPPPYVMQPQYGGPYGGQYAQPPVNVVQAQYGGPAVLVTAPMRETGPAPETACSLIISILSIFFCLGGWPFAVVAIIFNRKAKGQVDIGQYTAARSTLRTTNIFIAVTVIFGIIGWIIFAFRLKAALDIINDNDDDRYYYGK